MAKEAPSSEKVESAIQRAAAFRRIKPEELTDSGARMPPQFGNNFYLVFKARKFRNSSLGSGINKAYMDRAEALGEPWQRFLVENVQLLAEIDDALTEEDIYSDILALFRDFYSAHDFDGGDSYDRRFDPTLGINAIGIPIWQRLNHLLQQAAEAMKKAGIQLDQIC